MHAISFPIGRFGRVTIDRIKITLFAAFVFIYVAPYVPVLADNFTIAVVVFALLIGCYSAMQKSWMDLLICVSVAATFFIKKLIVGEQAGVDDSTFVLRTAAVLAFVLLNITLLIGPWAHFTVSIQKIYQHRRHIGVTAFLLATLHASLVINIYYDYSFKDAFATTFIFFGFTGFFILGWLALTSWDWVQKHVAMRSWKILHTFTLALWLGWLGYMLRTSVDFVTWHGVVLGIFVVAWLAFAPWSVPQKILRKVNGWKQLHVLVYIAYASITIHAWTGYIQFIESQISRVLFWAMVVAVVSSHAVGWILMLVQYMKSKRSTETITIDGKLYFKTARTESFTDGKGQRFDNAGNSVAVFKNGGTFFAMSARCPHQGGPIDQGKIEDGYVVCPWHRFQFSVLDGKGPAAFGDCIEYYPVVIHNDVVYVCVESTGACKK